MHEKELSASKKPSLQTYTSFRLAQTPHTKKMAQKARSKQKITRVILNYFIQEGFQASALSLSKEAGIHLENCVSDVPKLKEDFPLPPLDGDDLVSVGSSPSLSETKHVVDHSIKGFSSIEKRKLIKHLILRGDISEAIKTISVYFPTILDTNNLLLFKLLRLNLIEMIRTHRLRSSVAGTKKNEVEMMADEKKFLNDVLTFVRENLINKVTLSMDLLRELETTMSLLCFDFDPLKPLNEMSELPEELQKLLNSSLRNECYRTVNKVILDLESSNVPELQYKGVYFENISANSLGTTATAQPLEASEVSDGEELKFEPGSDVARSIENMISFAPDPNSEAKFGSPLEVFSESKEKDNSSYRSQLEEIFKLWVATESILLRKKLITKKQYIQEDADNSLHL